jgi:hypothetical protein
MFPKLKDFPTSGSNGLRDWTKDVKFRDQEWDDRLRRLYPAQKPYSQPSEHDFDDEIPF